MRELKGIEDFMKAIEKGTTIVEFYGPACPFCAFMEKVLQKTERQRNDVKFAKANVANEEIMQLAMDHEIDGVPTIFIYVEGRPILYIPGAVSINDLNKAIDTAIEMAKAKEEGGE